MASNRFAEALADALATRGVTQASLALAVGLRQNTVSRWVAGDFAPPPETVFAVEAVLELAPGLLSQHLGYRPANAEAPPTSVAEALRAAPELEDWQREAVLAVYRTFVGKGGRRPTLARRAG